MEYLGLNDKGYDIATVGDAQKIYRALMEMRDLFINNDVDGMRMTLESLVDRVNAIEEKLVNLK